MNPGAVVLSLLAGLVGGVVMATWGIAADMAVMAAAGALAAGTCGGLFVGSMLR